MPGFDILQSADRLAKKLLEKNTPYQNIQLAAWTLASSGRPEDIREAVRFCRVSCELAQNSIDSTDSLNLYAHGTSLVLHGLMYFLQGEEWWDQAALYCENAASLFASVADDKTGDQELHDQEIDWLRAQGIAWLAVGYISEAQCCDDRERWNRGLEAYVKAVRLLSRIDATLSQEANQSLMRLTDRFRSLRTPSHTATRVQNTNANSDTDPSHASFQPRHFVYDPPPVSSQQSGTMPIRLSNVVAIGGFVFLSFWLVIVILWDWQNPLAWAVGFECGFIGSLFSLLSVLWAAGHLHFHVPSSTEAVVQFRNGELSPHKEGSYWLIPGIERVCAFVPTTSIALELFPLEFKTRFLVPLVVRLKFNYKVIDSVILVKAIDAHPSQYLLGLPKPLTCKEVEEKIKDQFKSRVKEVIVQAIGDRNADKIREEFSGLKRQIRIDLRSLASSHYGIQVSDFNVEFYIYV